MYIRFSVCWFLLFLFSRGLLWGDEQPKGRGLTEANQERRLLDDMQDVSDWYNGSPDETALSAVERDGRVTLLFANTVDHTKGEKNYPIGWPRTGKDLARDGVADWSEYDFFECWVYADTSRDTLPKKPVGIGFYHSGKKRSTHIPLTSVKKNIWTRVEIPIRALQDPRDIQRIQFNISESDYKHGDQVDFYLHQPALVRYIDPAIIRLEPERRLLLTEDRVFRTHYTLAGYKGLETTKVRLLVRYGTDSPAGTTSAKAQRQGELSLLLSPLEEAGDYRAELEVRNAQGELLDRHEVKIRVIAGPFQEDIR